MYLNSCQKPYNMVSKTGVKYLSKTVTIEERERESHREIFRLFVTIDITLTHLSRKARKVQVFG